MSIARKAFGRVPDGRPVDAYRLENAHGLSTTILTIGAVIQALELPNGADVVLGYDTLASYLDDPACLGAVVGRFANRIAGAHFTLDGKTCELSKNDGNSTLHGGAHGFNKAVWRAHTKNDRLILEHESPNGDQGFPGTLQTTVTYTLGNDNALQIDFEARTDAPTVLNLTNHTYWNLSASDADILDHTLQVEADTFLPVDDTFIPTGERRPVSGPFDLRAPTALRIPVNDRADPQIARVGGLDHNFILRSAPGACAATLSHPATRRTVRVFTTEPGLQVYSGNSLNGEVGKGGRIYRRHSGIALETQHFPNSPNEPGFPTTVLRPGEIFRASTRFCISWT